MNRIVPLILAVALFMENMDSTVIATSLPAIAADIGTSPIALKLALTSYLVSLAIFIPISSWMADRFGAKTVFRSAIGVFIIGSIACAMAGSLFGFVLARFLQGMGGAMMTPVARLVLVRSTAKRDLVNAMAWLTMPALLGPLIGPPLGGFITTFMTWHWIFLINVPIGLAGIGLASRYLPDIEARQRKRIDGRGFVLSAVAASGIVFGLSVASLPALPPVVGLITVAIGVASGVLYIRHARKHPAPILDLKLFANPVYRAAILGGTIYRIGVGATPFLLPLLFQLGFGLTPFQSGMLIFASAAGALSMKLFAPATLRRAGFRTVLIGAALFSALLVAANALLTAYTPWLVIVALLFVAGLLRSLFFTSVNALAFAEVSEKEASQATAISAAAQQISVALGVALGGGILEASTWYTGHALTQEGFAVAFMIIAAVAASSALVFAGIPRDAGSVVSGHRLSQDATEQARL